MDDMRGQLRAPLRYCQPSNHNYLTGWCLGVGIQWLIEDQIHSGLRRGYNARARQFLLRVTALMRKVQLRRGTIFMSIGAFRVLGSIHVKSRLRFSLYTNSFASLPSPRLEDQYFSRAHPAAACST